MNATIASFRRGRTTQTMNQAVVVSDTVKTKEDAEKLVGKKITFTTSAGNTITGKITAPHGRNGQVRALFEKGIPGQALGKTVSVE